MGSCCSCCSCCGSGDSSEGQVSGEQTGLLSSTRSASSARSHRSSVTSSASSGRCSLQPLRISQVDRLFESGSGIVRDAERDRLEVDTRIVRFIRAFGGDLRGEVTPEAVEPLFAENVRRLRDSVQDHKGTLYAIVSASSPVKLSTFGMTDEIPPDMRQQLDAFDELSDALHDVASKAPKRRQQLQDLLSQVDDLAKGPRLNELAKASGLGMIEKLSIPKKLAANEQDLRRFVGRLHTHEAEAVAFAKVTEAVAKEGADMVSSND